MRLVSLAAIAALSLSLALPASALTVETNFSPEMLKKLEKDYGEREASLLADVLVKRVEAAFAKRGVAAERVVVTIHDARPNKPTMKQLADTPGLDGIRSLAIGGADVTGVAFDAAGKEIGQLQYKWYETDITNIKAAGTWSDARVTFDRFASRFADKLS